MYSHAQKHDDIGGGTEQLAAHDLIETSRAEVSFLF